MENENSNFFEKFGLEVSQGEIEIGKTYPIYGMITKIIEDSGSDITVELNFSIQARMLIADMSKVELLKERAFEPGIFVSTIVSKDPKVTVDCSTVVFGKKQQYAA